MSNKPRTKAERDVEREEAVLRQEQMLHDTRGKSAVRADQIPDEVPRPAPNKTFMAVGAIIAVLVVVAFVYCLVSSCRSSAHSRAPQTASEQQ